MESGRVLKRSSIVLFLFQCCKWQPNDNRMATGVSSCDEPKMGKDRGWKSCHLGRHYLGANDVHPKGQKCVIVGC